MVYGQHLVRLRLMLMAGVGRVDAAAAATSSHLLWRAASRPKLPEASSRSIIAKFFFSEDATVTSPHCTCLTHSQQLPAVLTRVQALCTKSYRTRHFKKNKRQRLFSLQLRHVRHSSARTLNSQHDNDNDLLPPPSPLQPPHSYLSNYYSTIFIKTRP